MLFMVRPDTKSVHLLASLLETIEVRADELLDLKFGAHDLSAIRAMSDEEVGAHLAALRGFIGKVRSLELEIIAKLGQAREKARSVSRTDWRLRPIVMLFTSGTQAFADLFASQAAPADQAFDGESQIFPYLRSRGLVSPLTTNYDGTSELLVTDSFRLLGAMTLRDLLERSEATLNALDAHYDLYDLEDDAAEEAATSSAPPVAVPAASVVDFGTALASAPATETATPAIVPAHPEPAPADIAQAQAASEIGLQGLTQRLAELKDETEGAPAGKQASAA